MGLAVVLMGAPLPRPYVTRVTHEQTGDLWEVSSIPGSVVAFHDMTRRQIDFGVDRYTHSEAVEFIRSGDFYVSAGEHVYAWETVTRAEYERAANRKAREMDLGDAVSGLTDHGLDQVIRYARQLAAGGSS